LGKISSFQAKQNKHKIERSIPLDEKNEEWREANKKRIKNDKNSEENFSFMRYKVFAKLCVVLKICYLCIF